MTSAQSSALARVLAAPWQQRRNVGSLWGLVFIVLACSSFPIVLFTLSLLGPRQDPALGRMAELSAWIGAGALLVVGWAMLVGNVLQQNRPALARLVPGHVGHLRAGLLAAWAVLILAAAAGPGFALDAPLAWACGAAAALALFAAALRWPVLWLAGVVAPFVAASLLRWAGRGALEAALLAEWRSADWLITAIVVTAGSVVLVMVVRTGGARHAAAFRRWRDGGELSQASFGALAASPPSEGCVGRFLGPFLRPYAWRMRRLLALRDSPVMARVLLGVGPATHWTTLFFQFFCALLFGTVLCMIVTPFLPAQGRAAVCAYDAMFVLILLSTPAVQQLHRVWQTRREQALLVLLPGVARGAALNRWLGWQMSWPFLVMSTGALVVSGVAAGLAEAIQPGSVEKTLGGMVSCFAVALLPLVACQWRGWARMHEPATLAVVGPVMGQMGLVMLALGLHSLWDVGYLLMGIFFALVALAWCAWRWWRMGGEPTALPIGRAAH